MRVRRGVMVTRYSKPHAQTARLLGRGCLTSASLYRRPSFPMKVKRSLFNAKLTEGDYAELRELASLLNVKMAAAMRVAVAEKLRRVKGKQKAQVAA